MIQVHVQETVWEFESPLRHQTFLRKVHFFTFPCKYSPSFIQWIFPKIQKRYQKRNQIIGIKLLSKNGQFVRLVDLIFWSIIDTETIEIDTL